ncbi:chitin synthase chs-2 isoform X1 [Zeugodacus cucurbitae]|uniref:chitin synthase chs-2 isoform X1 n=1 Tax=Zeugodacus cucurbitae TaxID=28588 RepID=UPI0023D95B87|nr:chitin synthase chs-2 isoform X1 [Zeugodacus cucurbitae]
MDGHTAESNDANYIKSRKSKGKPPLWDTFQDPPSRRATGSAASWEKLGCLLKLFKLLTYVFVFIVVLGTAVTSKISMLIMVTHFRANANMKICNIMDDDDLFTATLPKEEQYAWLWALIFAFSAPEVFTFFRALRICTFKDVKSPTWMEVMLVLLFEILHTIGLAILVFFVMPQLDSVRAIMLCNGVCFIPSILNIGFNPHFTWRSVCNLSLSALAIFAQLSAFLVWPTFSTNLALQILALPLILVSTRWWENYIASYNFVAHILQTVRRSRSKYQTYLYLSPGKIVVFSLIGFCFHGQPLKEYFSYFTKAWQSHDILVYRNAVSNESAFAERGLNYSSKIFTIKTSVNTVIYIMLLQICSSYLCYVFAKFACKIKIQEFSFSLPLNLAGPASVAMTIWLTSLRGANVCALHAYLPDYMGLILSDQNKIFDSIISDTLWLWPIWWLSQLWITRHIWRPRNEKNAPTEKLFICPWYCAFLVDQCILMNRRIIDLNDEYLTRKVCMTKVESSPSSVPSDINESDKIPQLIVCATMWHENQEEMMEFLKSIVRLDEDQCARRMAKLHINGGKADNEYYEFETNIFFDDAFVLDEKLCENSRNPPMNEYVKTLIVSIEKACFEVYGVNMKIKSPVKTETPYGGRLVWTLPGRSKMIAHLKNKDKIRHKKRWSQVMYMYYLLGFRIMELEGVSARRKAVIAENTFLLALDGDIDFQPQAVQLLIDRMKAIDELGAACGRIHPVGRGPMVWYQIFEYAIGHWLQKATEHVIGCVLCSPGCFSLFRGSALMENSVMKKYTTVSSEPMHYVQYDQGEDRWLCTLILKQGLRVEYSAASDAYTHSPEMFNEFYNQRRRWVPSTIANIFDLLSDADMVVKNNSSISTPYIAYQAMLMVGTILGPGTIFLMMVGALVAVFNTSIWSSFLWNFIPVLCFILSCIYLKQKFQLLLAFVISSLYCLVMMAVLIGIIIQMIDDGPLAPASLFFLLVFLQIFIAGIVHPQEVGALICGFIYYITIPSMYMLLLIYSVFNMNDVSWGTREVTVKKDDDIGLPPGDDVEDGGREFLPGWVNDPLLVDSELGEISLKEKRFWKDLIKLYLRPLFHTKDKKAEIAESLRELRNMFAFAFIMINSIFVLIVFLLQLKKDYLHLEWPIDPTDYITYDDINSQIYIYRRHKELDPIGFCFVIFFGLILVIQFIAMFFHRFATISQLLATTQLDWFRAPSTLTDEDAAQEIRGNAVNIARQLQRPKRLDDDDEDSSDGEDNLNGDDNAVRGNSMVRRHTIFKLHESRNKTQPDYSDLPRNFERRFLGEDDLKVKHISMSRKSLMMLNETRCVAKRRLTEQVKRNTDFNKNPLPFVQTGFTNAAFDPPLDIITNNNNGDW